MDAAFDETDEFNGIVGFFGEFFLCQSLFLAKSRNLVAEFLLDIHAVILRVYS